MIVDYVKELLVLLYTNIFGFNGAFSSLKMETAKVYPESINPEDIEKIKSVIDESIKKESYSWTDGQESDYRLYGVEKYIDNISEILNLEYLINQIELYSGRKIKSWTLMGNRTSYTENNKGSGGGLHRDSPFSHQIKCIWYLNNVTEINGPFTFLKGSNYNLLKSKGEYPLGKFRFKSVNGDMNVVTGDSGTLLVCDTKGIHAGKVLEAGLRYAITLYTFTDKDGVEKIV